MVPVDAALISRRYTAESRPTQSGRNIYSAARLLDAQRTLQHFEPLHNFILKSIPI
jgi:hypothetical protein